MTCPTCGCCNYSPAKIALFRGQDIHNMDEATKDKAVEYLIQSYEEVLKVGPWGSIVNLYECHLLFCALDEPRKQKAVEAECKLMLEYGV